jgi:uncharacterized protein YfkK (UPF0435 family)
MRYGKYIRIKNEKNDLSPASLTKRKIMDQEMEHRIWEYIDGNCSPSERAAIAQNLADHSIWKSKYNELMSIHDMLQKEELEMPSLRFTKNVMEEISRYKVAPATKSYINKNVIRGISSFFLVMILGLIIYFIGQIHWSSSSTGHLVPAFNLDANKLNWSKILNNTYVNIFIGINTILGLILLDKYMQGKKKDSHTGEWSKGDSA